MRFGRQMHDMGDLVALHDFEEAGFVTDVGMFEDVFRVFRNRSKIFEMTGVGEAIQINEFSDFGSLDNGVNDIGTDKTGATGNEQVNRRIQKPRTYVKNDI